MQHEPNAPAPQKNGNGLLLKTIITGILMLVMLIPTLFISNLVRERKERQKEVSAEVGTRWAGTQVLSGPYISLPYKQVYQDENKKVMERTAYLVILPDSLSVNGEVSHELRQRSIYKVLLYRADLRSTGDFIFSLPKDIDSSQVLWDDARLCYGLSDFKGVEEKFIATFNGQEYELSPGLPTSKISQKGLSASISLAATDKGKKIPFSLHTKIKGSEQLHFLPLAGDSRFSLQADWNSPSFDGSDLPSFRNITEKGFTATWIFNKANLPFSTVLNDFPSDQDSFAFGVTLVQPADGYAKTDRCIKYAILFIGLTFSLFFIIEIMQKKPVHPVQYILIGLALVIFFTLLLSISEFIPFDYAYLIAAVAVIILITVYAYAHFKRLQTSFVFAGTLSLLYGFTFVLIRLEDAALLIGSIGLFIILALTMYISRKINWYGDNVHEKNSLPLLKEQ